VAGIAGPFLLACARPRHRVVFLGRRDEQLPGVLGVTDGGLGIKAEHGGQVQRVGAAGEGFLELPVDAEPFRRGGLPSQCRLGEVAGADRTGAVGAVLVDQQVRVGRGGPAGAPVGEPLEQDLAGELIERAGPAADDDPPVAQVDGIEEELAQMDLRIPPVSLSYTCWTFCTGGNSPRRIVPE
jgi:hypothetical protein